MDYRYVIRKITTLSIHNNILNQKQNRFTRYIKFVKTSEQAALILVTLMFKDNNISTKIYHIYIYMFLNIQ